MHKVRIAYYIALHGQGIIKDSYLMDEAEIGMEYQRLINEVGLSVDEAGRQIYSWFLEGREEEKEQDLDG